ncbi:MAG: hypothetical protein JO013_12710 [Alphaproteobacteria bacterium]|nr:hypothetical protein [Alphaproteobacteria bacterium]
MRNPVPLLAAAGAALLAASALGQGTARRTMTCPVGGESFDYVVPVGVPPLGERPDGKPYGTPAPTPLPECPSNGLVLYKDYTPAEVEKLTPLVGSDDYQALRKADTAYYRAYWLMKKMEVPAQLQLLALLQAGWEADGRPELRARYLAEFADASAKVERRPNELRWIGMEARAVNALRELGRFDEAKARLEGIPFKSLDVPVPEGEAATEKAVSDARLRRAWLGFLTAMGPAIARKDASLEPFDLLPRSVALGRCLDAGAALPDPQKAFCESEKAELDKLREARARAEEEMKALAKSREQSGR